MAFNDCPVCYDTYASRERRKARLTLCGHAICEGCIDDWIKQNGATCPVCRSYEWFYLGYPYGGLPIVYVLNDVASDPPTKKPVSELRPDPTAPESRNSFSYAEFVDYYGKDEGTRLWRLAGHGENTERRHDPRDPSGAAYTWAEFTTYYGLSDGEHIWKLAGNPSEMWR